MSARLKNSVVLFADSEGWMGAGFKPETLAWPFLVEMGLRGYSTSAVVSVSGASIGVSPGTGALFQPGATLRFRPAGTAIARHPSRRRAAASDFTVLAQSGDTLTLSAAPPARLAPGSWVLGTGGGGAATVQNHGHSGDTTAQILARIPLQAFGLHGQDATPALALLLAGSNDFNPQGSSTIASTPTSTTTTLYTAPILISGVRQPITALAGPGSYVIVGSVAGCLVQGVTAGTGSAPDQIMLASALASAPASGVTVQCDTVNNLIAMATALASGGVPRIVMVGYPGNNFASGGDFPTQSTIAATKQAKQTAAASALGVPFIDLHAYCAALIAGGLTGVTATNELLNYVAGNVHPSLLCDQWMAGGVLSGLAAQSGWLAGLQ